ncbi:cytochrome P450 [Amanita rubescens]|nr:cytochrome P450 [Amanita rubescens]
MDANIVTTLAVVVSLYCVSSIWTKVSNHRRLSAIPAVGPSGILASYFGALRFVKNGKEMAQEGYDKYYGSIFKVPMLTQWMILVSGPRLIEDIRQASDDQLSLVDAAVETIHTDVLLGRESHDDTYHIGVVRNRLTRNIAVQFSEVHDEIAAAFAESVPTNGDEWTTIVAFKANLNIMCRVVNRFLVGLPLCRDPDYISSIQQLPIEISFVARFLRRVPKRLRSLEKHLEPFIKDRLEQLELHGSDWPDKPNDAITWLWEEAKEPHRRTIQKFAVRIIFMNFAGIHTTTLTYTTALYILATKPEYVQPMREEIEAAISEEGWTKSAIGKLRKVDSFIRETMRMYATGVFNTKRKVLKDFTFSNGMTVPAGCLISLPHRAVQCDAVNYSDPDVFDGFRYARMREREGEGTKHGMVTTTNEYLPFGLGRHSCPGRFFATNNIKAMFAYILMNYDVKMAGEQGLPSEKFFGIDSTPDLAAKMMFRKRQT